MKIAKNKTIAIAIAIFFAFSMTASMMLIPNASAHTPAWQIPTYAYIQALPNPVGVGQSVHIIMWLDNVIDGAELGNNVRFQNYELTITAPDGTKTTQTWAVVSDPTSDQGYTFTPTQAGTYNLAFTFPGQVYTYTGPLSLYGGMQSAYIGDTYLPSNASATLTVQQAPLGIYPTTPLPTAYWTRPIYGENSNWYTISSNWLGSGAPGYGLTNGMFTPDDVFPGDAGGPQTSHVMWTKPLDMGGVVGGNETVIQGDTYFEGSCYNARYTNPIILDGMLYYTEPISFAGATSGPTVCVNLQTGQQIWSSTAIPALSFGYIYDVQDPNQHGVYPPILIASVFSYVTFTTNWQAYDAYTGDYMFTVTNVPSGTTILGPEGEHLILSLVNLGTPAAPNYYLQEWNSSKLWEPDYSGASTSPPVVPVTTNGSWTGGYVNLMTMFGPVPTYVPSLYDWNISIPSINTMASPLTILDVFYNNMVLCMSGTYPGLSSIFTLASWSPYTYFAVNLNPARGAVGSVLWTNTVTPAAGNITVSFIGADPTANGGTGVFVEYHRETMQYVGYSMTTGKQIWGPIGTQTGLNYYNYDTVPTGSNDQCAYGNLYSTGYGGVLYCYDLTNGNLLWTYGNGGEGNSTNSGLPYPGPYPMVIYAIGDGIVYTVTCEHTVETPIYKGALARAINATTGQEIWTLSDDNNGGSGAIADGFATFFNGYDNQIYSVGRGPSATTVTAPDFGLSFGTPVVITGTVMDISAGTTQTEQAADFPNGVPVASDASMTQWMSYVYQQQPEPTNFTGVQVQLAVLDSNGNHYPIGTATTNEYGTYSLTWTPDIPGNYTIFATFAGTNGYWPSSADTYIYAGSPPATPAPTATPVTGLATALDLTYGIVAAIIVIIIIGAILAMLMLRKRP